MGCKCKDPKPKRICFRSKIQNENYYMDYLSEQDKAMATARLAICMQCQLCDADFCKVSGEYVYKKVTFLTGKCPRDYWD
jgi:hypothetical protein